MIPVAENLPCNAGDSGLSPGWGIKILQAETTEDCVLSPRTTTKIRQSQMIFFKKKKKKGNRQVESTFYRKSKGKF